MSQQSLARCARRPRMTEAEAKDFDHYSPANIVRVLDAMAAKGCQCQPYADVYTYGRWTAQGMQVQRGEKSIAIPIIVNGDDEEDPDGEIRPGVRLLWTAHLFCRCQVQPRTPANGHGNGHALWEAKEQLRGYREAKFVVPAFGTYERDEYDAERRRKSQNGIPVMSKAKQMATLRERIRLLEIEGGLA